MGNIAKISLSRFDDHYISWAEAKKDLFLIENAVDEKEWLDKIQNSFDYLNQSHLSNLRYTLTFPKNRREARFDDMLDNWRIIGEVPKPEYEKPPDYSDVEAEAYGRKPAEKPAMERMGFNKTSEEAPQKPEKPDPAYNQWARDTQSAEEFYRMALENPGRLDEAAAKKRVLEAKAKLRNQYMSGNIEWLPKYYKDVYKKDNLEEDNKTAIGKAYKARRETPVVEEPANIGGAQEGVPEPEQVKPPEPEQPQPQEEPANIGGAHAGLKNDEVVVEPEKPKGDRGFSNENPNLERESDNVEEERVLRDYPSLLSYGRWDDGYDQQRKDFAKYSPERLPRPSVKDVDEIVEDYRKGKITAHDLTSYFGKIKDDLKSGSAQLPYKMFLDPQYSPFEVEKALSNYVADPDIMEAMRTHLYPKGQNVSPEQIEAEFEGSVGISKNLVRNLKGATSKFSKSESFSKEYPNWQEMTPAELAGAVYSRFKIPELKGSDDRKLGKGMLKVQKILDKLGIKSLIDEVPEEKLPLYYNEVQKLIEGKGLPFNIHDLREGTDTALSYGRSIRNKKLELDSPRMREFEKNTLGKLGESFNRVRTRGYTDLALDFANKGLPLPPKYQKNGRMVLAYKEALFGILGKKDPKFQALSWEEKEKRVDEVYEATLKGGTTQTPPQAEPANVGGAQAGVKPEDQAKTPPPPPPPPPKNIYDTFNELEGKAVGENKPQKDVLAYRDFWKDLAPEQYFELIGERQKRLGSNKFKRNSYAGHQQRLRNPKTGRLPSPLWGQDITYGQMQGMGWGKEIPRQEPPKTEPEPAKVGNAEAGVSNDQRTVNNPQANQQQAEPRPPAAEQPVDAYKSWENEYYTPVMERIRKANKENNREERELAIKHLDKLFTEVPIEWLPRVMKETYNSDDLENSPQLAAVVYRRRRSQPNQDKSGGEAQRQAATRTKYQDDPFAAANEQGKPETDVAIPGEEYVREWFSPRYKQRKQDWENEHGNMEGFVKPDFYSLLKERMKDSRENFNSGRAGKNEGYGYLGKLGRAIGKGEDYVKRGSENFRSGMAGENEGYGYLGRFGKALGGFKKSAEDYGQRAEKSLEDAGGYLKKGAENFYGGLTGENEGYGRVGRAGRAIHDKYAQLRDYFRNKFGG